MEFVHRRKYFEANVEANAGGELLFKGTSRSENKSSNRRKEPSSLARQSKNAMMSSISPREEQSSSKAKKSFETMYNEHMTSLQTDQLTFGSDHLGLVHSHKEFTPSSKQEKNKKAMSNSPPRPMPGVITIGTSLGPTIGSNHRERPWVAPNLARDGSPICRIFA